jgi:hypothetical protein
MFRGRSLLLLLLVLPVAACDFDRARVETANAATSDGGATVVDSIFPIEEEVRRFRATLTEHPTALANTSPSREALVDRFLRALATADTSELRRMALSRAEFAYLYYPTTQFAAPPYELSPALVWYRLESYSSRGLVRALNRFGARPLHATGHSCETEPLVQGENTLWHGCVVRVRGPDGDIATVTLFGPILERAGEFKLLSFANGM